MRSLLPDNVASVTNRRKAPSCGERANTSLAIMRSTAALISAGAGAFPIVSGISGMPIPLEKKENPETGRGKRAEGCHCHRLTQIDAELDASRAQLVVVGRAFKNFSHVREQSGAATLCHPQRPGRKCGRLKRLRALCR